MNSAKNFNDVDWQSSVSRRSERDSPGCLKILPHSSQVYWPVPSDRMEKAFDTQSEKRESRLFVIFATTLTLLTEGE